MVEMSVGDLAHRSGVSVTALHFYERKGLIRSRRSQGNQRRYDRAVLRRVALIKVAQELGFSLAEIGARLAELPDDRPPSRSDWEMLATHWAGELDHRIALMQNLRSELTGCIGCGCLSMERCTLLNTDDRLAGAGNGPVRLMQEAEA
ncbi:redox-sensitive transcriptional activator SoxR [Labrys sp. LIt4]|uniref:Redox-sensitive transcriptional activator SoxR n=1 Tax=Labrys okinawensis TaxID=346911 RepID=A0A2S9Q4L5_9HYPH|nr:MULTISPECIES: redox-sensitive transcriptional activator SoxR [Labrys]MBP0578546.1 redox-sensitive transcriptional activator SoxR [Labrys sp. LIt4]PRH84302.1 redox-sensitive transcriptional activator SoxR [Labrys okinawensis]